MERYRKGNFNQGRKFSRYDSQTSLNLENINNLNVNVEMEMGLKVEEKRIFYEEESGKFLFCVCACLIFPKEKRGGGVYVIYRALIKEPIPPPPPSTLHLFYYSIILFYLFLYISSVLQALGYKKILHRGGGF